MNNKEQTLSIIKPDAVERNLQDEIKQEFIGKGYGGFLLSKALTIGFQKASRIWVHTCSLDHPNAIKNYKSRGMRIFKTEILKRKAI